MPRRRGGAWRMLSSSFSTLLSSLYCVWQTQMLNQVLYYYGRAYSRFFRMWFTVGIGSSFVACVAILLICTWQLRWLFSVDSHENTAAASIEQRRNYINLMVPGFNVPWSDFFYMFFGTIFAVGFHEVGHALAAASEGVPIEHVAVFVACLFPGALVALDHDSFQILSPVRKLRIECAGIWHNFVCCAGCSLFLILLPTLLYPWYLHDTGLMILSTSSNSPLSQHLQPGHRILEVSDLHPKSLEEWFHDLQLLGLQASSMQNLSKDNFQVENYAGKKESLFIGNYGFCVPRHKEDLELKPATSICSKEEFPFLANNWLKTTTLSTELSGIESSHDPVHDDYSTFCLKPDDVMGRPTCSGTELPSLDAQGTCPNSDLCMLPQLQYGELLMKIVHMDPRAKGCSSWSSVDWNRQGFLPLHLMSMNHSGEDTCIQSLFFVGDPMSLAFSLQLTNYIRRKISVLGLFDLPIPLWFPSSFERFLTYTFYISMGIAMLNSAPVFYLDGEAIMQSSLSLCAHFVHPWRRRQILHICLTFGSILLTLGMLSGIIKQFI